MTDEAKKLEDMLRHKMGGTYLTGDDADKAKAQLNLTDKTRIRPGSVIAQSMREGFSKADDFVKFQRTIRNAVIRNMLIGLDRPYLMGWPKHWPDPLRDAFKNASFAVGVLVGDVHMHAAIKAGAGATFENFRAVFMAELERELLAFQQKIDDAYEIHLVDQEAVEQFNKTASGVTVH